MRERLRVRWEGEGGGVSDRVGENGCFGEGGCGALSASDNYWKNGRR